MGACYIRASMLMTAQWVLAVWRALATYFTLLLLLGAILIITAEAVGAGSESLLKNCQLLGQAPGCGNRIEWDA